jgi:hypothetical protein
MASHLDRHGRRAGILRAGPACPAPGAARPAWACPAYKRTSGIKDELGFDSQKKDRNHKNPLTGSVHTFRGLPPPDPHLEIADDLDPDFIRDINQRRAELRALHDDLEGQLAAAQQQGQGICNPALLDHLPVAEVDLEGMPDDVSRRFFEALRLEIRYDPAARTARCSITLAGDTIDAVSRIAQEATARGPSRCATRPAGMVPGRGDGLCSAPSRIRTYAPGSGGRCSIP